MRERALKEGAQSRLWGAALCLRSRRLGWSIPPHRPEREGYRLAVRRRCATYSIAECTIVLLLAAAALFAFLGGHALPAAFALGNAVPLAYAITSFIGHGNGWQDVRPVLPGVARRAARNGAEPIVPDTR